jgi:hypothetical protein
MDRTTRSLTWFYSLNLRLKAGTSFFDILSSERFQQFQRDKLGKASINSFSIDTLPSSVFLVNGVACSHIVGFISGTRMRCSTVQDWLTHDDFFNLDLTPIANRDTNDQILTFLRNSALADDPAHAAGERLRLRVDLLEASAGAATRKKPTGRPLKNREQAVPPSKDESAAVTGPSLSLTGVSAATAVAAPHPRAPSRLRVQYRACGTDPRATCAASH